MVLFCFATLTLAWKLFFANLSVIGSEINEVHEARHEAGNPSFFSHC